MKLVIERGGLPHPSVHVTSVVERRTTIPILLMVLPQGVEQCPCNSRPPTSSASCRSRRRLTCRNRAR